MNSCEFRHFDFQNNLVLLRVNKLIQCSKYIERIEALRISGKNNLYKKWEHKLLQEMRRGQILELQLSQACKEARVSQEQLRFMGYTRTFAQINAKYY